MTKVVYPVIGRQTSLPFYLTGIGISDLNITLSGKKGLFLINCFLPQVARAGLSLTAASIFKQPGLHSIFRQACRMNTIPPTAAG
ncbi:hypothetical protein [uncultured Ruminococcus sp.]|uniref:hypothetical protein n=1 Tax=uncultured Ruminococcus sp. TaxID=165186 RepID=UPI0025F73EEC|nr:hypothetical protein [uncultured Ruminococcus sp.]